MQDGDIVGSQDDCSKNKADGLTKPLTKAEFEAFRINLSITNSV